MKAKIYTADQLISKKLPLREPVLELLAAPDKERVVIRAGNLVELVAGTGVGKTLTAMSMAIAISTGKRFLHWRGSKPRKVLYIDGEMDSNDIQDRLIALYQTMGIESTNHNLAILCQDLQTDDKGNMRPVPRLDTEIGSKLIEPLMQSDWVEDNTSNHILDEDPAWVSWGAEVIIIDNAACLLDPLSEIEMEHWAPAQALLLKLRHMGKTVILIHHMGLQNRARGLTAREDSLNVILKLTKPKEDYPEGSKFKANFSKGRSLFGKARLPFDAWCHNETGWSFKLKDKYGAKGIELGVNQVLPPLEESILVHIASHDHKNRCNKEHMKKWVKGGANQIETAFKTLLDYRLVIKNKNSLQLTFSGEAVVELYNYRKHIPNKKASSPVATPPSGGQEPDEVGEGTDSLEVTHL